METSLRAIHLTGLVQVSGSPGAVGPGPVQAGPVAACTRRGGLDLFRVGAATMSR